MAGDLVLETFNAHEAQLILAMPLSWMRREDSWMWNFTKHGNYTVKSGYYRAPVMARTHDGPSTSSTLFGGNQLWSLNIPEKVHLLIWNAYQNVIPTKDNLHKKHVDVDLECPLCGVERESIFHCFISCSLARAVWLGCPLNLRVSELPVDDFANFFDTTASVLRKEQLELEYRIAVLSRGRGAAVVQKLSETRWHPLDSGFIKLNVDEAISVQNSVFGMGALARNHAGEWAHSLTFRRIVVESDCATIVSAITSETLKMNSSLGLILLNCKALLASFESCRVQHVCRVGNAAAHELAQRALSAEADEFWVDAIPATIMSIVNGKESLCNDGEQYEGVSESVSSTDDSPADGDLQESHEVVPVIKTEILKSSNDISHWNKGSKMLLMLFPFYL
ncbi:hypothetical protein SLEP1_g43166 [Rubroshorea leprosula]|uniref:RNase H type-1 domain-containing protein n=1 Tax=Rubroshorea leprosula TaxID=152421 RepID=A0AAV5LC49_9ROSI|nr:hypothetical protein SLEP1_g43166 [Rubroshorea leprosula]